MGSDGFGEQNEKVFFLKKRRRIKSTGKERLNMMKCTQAHAELVDRMLINIKAPAHNNNKQQTRQKLSAVLETGSAWSIN